MKSTRLFATALVIAVVPMFGCAKASSQPAAAYPDPRAETMGQTELQAPGPTTPPTDESRPCPDPAVPAAEGTSPPVDGTSPAAAAAPAPEALVGVRPDGTPVALKDVPAPPAAAVNPKCVLALHALPASR